MEYYSNPGKPLITTVGDQQYLRHAIKTHFISADENYLDILHKYVSPYYQEGDIITISEKVIAITQKQFINKSNLQLSPLANFLSRFVHVTPAGDAVGNPYKMQVAIEKVGIFKILIASILAAITRPLGIRGIFYRVVGNDIQGLDGFNDYTFDYYEDKGVLTPKQPEKVCENIKKHLNMDAVIVDANDLGVDILANGKSVELSKDTIKEIIRDNPAGQKQEQTPFILIRKVR